MKFWQKRFGRQEPSDFQIQRFSVYRCSSNLKMFAQTSSIMRKEAEWEDFLGEKFWGEISLPVRLQSCGELLLLKLSFLYFTWQIVEVSWSECSLCGNKRYIHIRAEVFVIVIVRCASNYVFDHVRAWFSYLFVLMSWSMKKMERRLSFLTLFAACACGCFTFRVSMLNAYSW